MRRPRISTNLAISIDGKISPAGGLPSGWTSKADHERLLDLRRNADALLVGRGTLEADNMTLMAPGASPLRCVASRSGAFRPEHPLFHTPGGAVHLLVGNDGDAPDVPGATIHRGDLAVFLRILADDLRVERLHCEGGGGLIRELANLDAIDEFHLTVAAHALFGGTGAVTPTGIPAAFLKASRTFELASIERVDGADECFLSYRRTRPDSPQWPPSVP
ncbi:MAG: RibD family protein [Verrucomicrobiae bacterium]|nr:RibD family protein [Verrucomicrobiae bacterium]